MKSNGTITINGVEMPGVLDVDFVAHDAEPATLPMPQTYEATLMLTGKASRDLTRAWGLWPTRDWLRRYRVRRARLLGAHDHWRYMVTRGFTNADVDTLLPRQPTARCLRGEP